MHPNFRRQVRQENMFCLFVGIGFHYRHVVPADYVRHVVVKYVCFIFLNNIKYNYINTIYFPWLANLNYYFFKIQKLLIGVIEGLCTFLFSFHVNYTWVGDKFIIFIYLFIY